MSENAVILFTRIPVAGKTKTRLMPLLTGDECKYLHIAFLRDIFFVLHSSKFNCDIIVCYLPDGDVNELHKILPDGDVYIPQRGETLGDRMYNAFCDVFDMGYERCLLIGSDIPLLNKSIVNNAFKTLDCNDIVICPTTDGGYYLIGMKYPCKSLFNLDEYGISSVLKKTISASEKAGKTLGFGEVIPDIDDSNDLIDLAYVLMQKNPDTAPETRRFLSTIKIMQHI